MLLIYPVIFKKTRNGYISYFPDFPEIKVQSRTTNELIKLCKSALIEHASTILKSGKELPNPTEINKLSNYLPRTIHIVRCKIF